MLDKGLNMLLPFISFLCFFILTCAILVVVYSSFHRLFGFPLDLFLYLGVYVVILLVPLVSFILLYMSGPSPFHFFNCCFYVLYFGVSLTHFLPFCHYMLPLGCFSLFFYVLLLVFVLETLLASRFLHRMSLPVVHKNQILSSLDYLRFCF